MIECRWTAAAQVVLCMAAAASLSPAAWPQNYPSRPVRIVSSASPGTNGDAGLRMMAAKMTESMGQPVVVELMTAARGGQAYAVVSKAAPDGHTITFGTSGTYVYGRFLFKNMAFDTLKDYAPIGMAFNSPEFVAVHASLQIGTLKELIEYAKRNPGKLEYASTGIGSYFHLAGESLKKAAGIDVLHVPYAQANFPQMVNDWSSGRVAMWFPTWATLSPNLSKVRALAVLDHQRSPRLPEVPTVDELLPGYQPFVVWWGFFGPAGLPAPLASRISAEVRKALQAGDVVPKLDDLGLVVVASTPEEFASGLRQEINTIGTLVNAIGLKPE